jgi:hypothetical protein
MGPSIIISPVGGSQAQPQPRRIRKNRSPAGIAGLEKIVLAADKKHEVNSNFRRFACSKQVAQPRGTIAPISGLSCQLHA